jgi:hypothetical protein
MSHFAIFKKSQTRLNLVAAAFLTIILLNVIAAPTVFNLIKFIVIGVISWQLMQGEKWAVKAILALAAISLYQALVLLVSATSDWFTAVVYAVFALFFGYVMYYFYNSEDLENFFLLKNSGFLYKKGRQPSFDSLFSDQSQLLEVDVRSFGDSEQYKSLFEELLEKAKLNSLIQRVEMEDDKLLLHTSSGTEPIRFNNRLSVFDHTIINKVNAVLQKIRAEKRVYRVWPQGILVNEPGKFFLAALHYGEYQVLVKNGYAKNK